MNGGVGSTRQHSEIEFTKAIKGFYHFGKMDISGESEIHTTLVWFPLQASIVRRLLNEIIRLDSNFISNSISHKKENDNDWFKFCRCENLNDKARVKPLALRHLSGID